MLPLAREDFRRQGVGVFNAGQLGGVRLLVR
jgi:hypothetical protein